MNSKYRYLIPNTITFISLSCGLISILLSASGHLTPAAILIAASYILDLFDGASARYFNAGSEFGLQLDSLVDMVSLGAAPAVLAFMYLQATAPLILLWPLTVLFALAGAFRLARFNLLPAKTSGGTDSAGLTISSAGATLALAVWSDMTMLILDLPPSWLLALMLVLGVLMVSKVPFPSFVGVFSGKVRIGILLVLFTVSLIMAPFGKAWFFWNNVYLGWGLVRAGYQRLN